MQQDIDTFVYIENFSSADIVSFLNRYLIKYSPNSSVVYYEYPQFGNDEVIFETSIQSEMIDFVLSNADREYRFDFESKVNANKATVKIYKNKNVILGLYSNTEEEYNRIEREFKEYYKTDNVFSCFFVPPPNSLEELFEVLGINKSQ